MQEAYQYTVPKTVETLTARLRELGFLRSVVPPELARARIKGFLNGGELLIVRDFVSLAGQKGVLVSTNRQYPIPYVLSRDNK